MKFLWSLEAWKDFCTFFYESSCSNNFTAASCYSLCFCLHFLVIYQTNSHCTCWRSKTCLTVFLLQSLSFFWSVKLQQQEMTTPSPCLLWAAWKEEEGEESRCVMQWQRPHINQEVTGSNCTQAEEISWVVNLSRGKFTYRQDLFLIGLSSDQTRSSATNRELNHKYLRIKSVWHIHKSSPGAERMPHHHSSSRSVMTSMEVGGQGWEDVWWELEIQRT